MKKNGFTLIELLAVIVILGLIMAVTAKDIIGVIENSKMKATKYDVAGILDDLSNQIHSLEIENKDYAGTYTVKDGIILEENNFDLEMKKNYNGIITINDDKEITSALGDSRYCVSKNGNDYMVAANQFVNKKCAMSSFDKCFHVRDGVIEWYGEKKYELGNVYSGSCNVGDLEIPSYIFGQKIKEIGRLAFMGLGISSLVLPDSLEVMGEEAFIYNDLTSITFGNSLKVIGTLAFAYNDLTTVDIPISVIYIGGGAFNNNQLSSGAEYIYQRNSNGSIDNTNLVSFGSFIEGDYTVPNNVSIIGNYAFFDNRITNLIIPNTVEKISEFAFADNYSLSLITFSGGTKIGERAINDRAFYDTCVSRIVYPSSTKQTWSAVFGIKKEQFFSTGFLKDEYDENILEVVYE